MDFFARQDRARRHTRWLVVLFGLALPVVVGLFYLVIAPVVYAAQHPLLHAAWWNPIEVLITTVFLLGEALGRPVHFFQMIWNPSLAGWIAVGTLLSVAVGCIYQFRILARGGSAVAELLGGRRIDPATRDPEEKRLCNVVEEMAIAAGMPMPEVFVLD